MPDPFPIPTDKRRLPNDSQEMAVVLVGPGQEVLEIGCGPGHVTERLVANGCKVVGIEIDPDAADSARTHAAEVHVVDLDDSDPADLVGAGRLFDRILVSDVLEHLKDPGRTLRQLSNLLTPDGYLVASIPNVTHADVRLMLLSGEWRTQDHGLLDRTHLRFFDRRGLIELFHDSGWRIERLERTTKPAFASELAELIPRSRFPDDAIGMIAADPESSTYQFVVVARPGTQEPAEADELSVPANPPEWAAEDSTVERLVAENEHLRILVRELEERIEDALWVRAIWRHRAHRLADALRACPKRVTSGLRRGRR